MQSSLIVDSSAAPINSFVDTFMKKKQNEESTRLEEEQRAAEELSRQLKQEAEARKQARPRTTEVPPPSMPSDNQVDSARSKAIAAPSHREVNSAREKQIQALMSSREPYNIKKDKFEQTMANYVFTKFLIPEGQKEVREDNPAVKRNMELAYDRLFENIQQEEKAKEKKAGEMRASQEAAFRDYCSRQENEIRMRNEITASLHAQSKFDRERKMKELEELKESAIMKPGFRAYPIAKPLDLKMEYDVKKELRESLNRQIELKMTSDSNMRSDKVMRERKILSTLHNDLRKEREMQLKKTKSNHQAMTSHWERQIEISQRMRETMKM